MKEIIKNILGKILYYYYKEYLRYNMNSPEKIAENIKFLRVKQSEEFRVPLSLKAYKIDLFYNKYGLDCVGVDEKDPDGKSIIFIARNEGKYSIMFYDKDIVNSEQYVIVDVMKDFTPFWMKRI